MIGSVLTRLGKIQKDMLEKRKAGLLGMAEPHLLSCPHCKTGGAVVVVERGNGGVKLPTGEAVRCTDCRRFFQVGVQLKLYGKAIQPTP